MDDPSAPGPDAPPAGPVRRWHPLRRLRRLLPEPTALVFISYRRTDSGGHAQLLADDLQKRYGDDRVFFDVESIVGGSGPWREQIDEQLAHCRATVVVVGPDWVEEIARRAELGSEDVVRYELKRSHEMGRAIVAARVGRAEPPVGLADDLAWLEDEHFIEVVPGQQAGGYREVRRALDRVLPMWARRWARVFVASTCTVALAGVIVTLAARLAQPCWFERCLPTYGVGDSVLLIGPGAELDHDGSPEESDAADGFVEDLTRALSDQLGDDTTVYRLDAGQLDVEESIDDVGTAIIDVLDRSRADLLITNTIQRSGASGVANRTEYRSEVHLGYVRDAEDLAGRQLEFATFETDVLFDIAQTDRDELVALATERLVGIASLLDTMHEYEVRHLDDALAGFDRLLEGGLGTADAALIHHLRANTLLELGEIEAASEGYERARELDPSFTRASLGLAEVDLLRALGLRCERSGSVLDALTAAADRYEETLATAEERADPTLEAKALIGLGRTAACRSLIHAGGDPEDELAVGDVADAYFRRAWALVDDSNADLLREALSAAGLSEARLALRRAEFLDALPADSGAPTRDAELARAEQLLASSDGVLARTNRRWVTAEAHELLAAVHTARGNTDAADEEHLAACRDYERVIDDAPGHSLVEQSAAAVTRLGC